MPTARARTTRSSSPAAPRCSPTRSLPGGLLPPRLAAAVEPWRASAPAPGGLAGGLLPRRPHRDAPAARALRRARIHVRGGPRPRPARRGRRRRDVVLARGARAPRGRALERARFGGEPFELLARRRREVVRERRGAGRARATTSSSSSPSPTGSLLKRLTAATRRERRQLTALLRARARTRVSAPVAINARAAAPARDGRRGARRPRAGPPPAGTKARSATGSRRRRGSPTAPDMPGSRPCSRCWRAAPS